MSRILERGYEPAWPVAACATCGLIPSALFTQDDCRIAACPKATVEVRDRAEYNKVTGKRPGGFGANTRYVAPHLPHTASS